jgi:hypothetical protein
MRESDLRPWSPLLRERRTYAYDFLWLVLSACRPLSARLMQLFFISGIEAQYLGAVFVRYGRIGRGTLCGPPHDLPLGNVEIASDIVTLHLIVPHQGREIVLAAL